MDLTFLVLSLPEAAYLYCGLAIQSLLRSSSLRHVPSLMILIWTMVLLWRAQGRPGGYHAVIGYLGTSLILCILFFPECVPFGRTLGAAVAPAQVGSYAATQDPNADVITAEDTGQVPLSLPSPVLIPPGLKLLLRVVTETPLGLARVINAQAGRTFASLMPMSFFLEVQLPADQMAAVGDFTHGCYIPTLLEMMNGQDGRTIEDLLPFGDSPLRQQLAQHVVTPSAQNGITWMRGPDPNNVTPCSVYLDALMFQAQNWLTTLHSPAGTPYLDLFQQELGLDPPTQASLLLYREMLKAAGPAVPAPSLMAQYGKLRGTSVAIDTIGGAGSGWLASGTTAGTVWGAVTGLFRGVGGDIQRGLDGLAWLVRVAMITVWYGPYIVGLINLVLLGLFPFVFIWALIPGTQFLPLAEYFTALLLTSSVPLWWALVDQVARLASQQPPVVDGAMGTVWQVFISTGMWMASITALGLILVPLVVGLLYFAAFRAIGSLWRGMF